MRKVSHFYTLSPRKEGQPEKDIYNCNFIINCPRYIHTFKMIFESKVRKVHYLGEPWQCGVGLLVTGELGLNVGVPAFAGCIQHML